MVNGTAAAGVCQRPATDAINCSFANNLNQAQVDNFLDHMGQVDAWQESGYSLKITLAKVAGCGWLDALQKLAGIHGLSQGSAAAASAAAAGKGHLNTLRCISNERPLGQFDAYSCLIAAAEAGHHSVAVWLHQQYPVYFTGPIPCMFAAERGSQQALEVLSNMDPPCSLGKEVCLMAGELGHWNVVRWLLHRMGATADFLGDFAACTGSLVMLAMLQKHIPDVSIGIDAICKVAFSGDMEALQLLECQIRALSEQHFLQLLVFLLMGSGPDPEGMFDGCQLANKYPRMPRQPPLQPDHLGAIRWLLDLGQF